MKFQNLDEITKQKNHEDSQGREIGESVFYTLCPNANEERNKNIEQTASQKDLDHCLKREILELTVNSLVFDCNDKIYPNSQKREVGESVFYTQCPKTDQEHNGHIEETASKKDLDHSQKRELPELTVNLVDIDCTGKIHPKHFNTSKDYPYDEAVSRENFVHYQERKIGDSCFYISHLMNDGKIFNHNQEKQVGDLFAYISYSETNQKLKENSSETGTQVHYENCNAKKISKICNKQKYSTIAEIGYSHDENIYSMVSDCIENPKEDSLLGKENNYSVIALNEAHVKAVNNNTYLDSMIKSAKNFQNRDPLEKCVKFSNLRFDKKDDNKISYKAGTGSVYVTMSPGISNRSTCDLEASYELKNNTEGTTKQVKLNNYQESHIPQLDFKLTNVGFDNDNTAINNESAYTEPYGSSYNETKSGNPYASVDEHIYCTIDEQVYSTVGDIPRPAWIYEALSMLDSVGNFDHTESLNSDATLNMQSSKLSASCYDLRNMSGQRDNPLSISTCNLRSSRSIAQSASVFDVSFSFPLKNSEEPPPLPPKNKIKLSNESSVSQQGSNLNYFGTLNSNEIKQNKEYPIGEPTSQMPIKDIRAPRVGKKILRDLRHGLMKSERPLRESAIFYTKAQPYPGNHSPGADTKKL